MPYTGSLAGEEPSRKPAPPGRADLPAALGESWVALTPAAPAEAVAPPLPPARELARAAQARARAAEEAFRSGRRELLAALRSPDDLRRLPPASLDALAAEIRAEILKVVAENGGHFSSNFGAVELTIALHRVFDFRRDRLIFDVGHQVYPHKLLTGRFGRFASLRTRGGLSGYPNPKESEYDLFVSGHAGAATGLGVGLAEGARLAGENRKVVVVVGDGALTSGMAFEALNHAGSLGLKNLLVVLNDNGMAIARTPGAISRGLARVRGEPLYREFREKIRTALGRLPVIGGRAEQAYNSFLGMARRAFVPGQIFRELNFVYLGPVDGHDIASLTAMLEKARQLEGPLLLHAVTEKGHGFPDARDHPERMHAPTREMLLKREGADGSPSRHEATTQKPPPYTDVFARALVRLAAGEPRLVAITAAMPSGTGLERFRDAYPERYFDVGICEQHALAFAAGLARQGRLPVAAIYSTFLQRAFDQVFHELCLQEKLHVVLALDRAGLVGTDGPTHAGLYDIACLRLFPGMVLMAPKDARELEAMLEFAVRRLDGPVALRYPRAPVPEPALDAGEPRPVELGRGEILREGSGTALLAYGALVAEALGAAERLAADGPAPTVANARFAKPLDLELLRRLLSTHQRVVTLEEHALAGGFGSACLEAAAAAGLETQRLVPWGVADGWVEHARREEQLELCGLSAARLAARLRELR